MNFLEWLADKMGVRSEVGINDPILCATDDLRKLTVQAYAFELAVDFVARMVAATTIITKHYGENREDKMYYRLNIEPNMNMTATEFWKIIVRKMLIGGEALVIPHRMPGRQPDTYLIADSYEKVERNLIENRYTDIRIGDYPLSRRGEKNTFNESEVWVFRFDNKELKDYTRRLSIGIEKILDVVQRQYVKKKYTKSVIEMVGMHSMKGEETTKIQELYDKNIRNFLNVEADAVLPLGNNQKIGRFESVMGDGVIDDAVNIRMFTEQTILLNAAMFNIPVQALYGETVDLTGWFSSFLGPFTKAISQEINRKSYGMNRMANNSYCYFDLSKLVPQTELDRAKMLDLLLRSGTHTINENRKEKGLELIDEPWADMFWMTLNYDFVERFVSGTQGSRGTPDESEQDLSDDTEDEVEEREGEETGGEE